MMKKIPDGSVDLIICDLPYGITANSWDKVIDFKKLWKEYHRISKPDTPIVLTAQQPFTTDLINSNRKEFRYCWQWYKHKTVGFLNAKKRPLMVFEDVVVFYRKAGRYFPIMRQGAMREKGMGGHSTNYRGTYKHVKSTNNLYYPTQLIDIPKENKEQAHPTQKPIALMEYLIRTYTKVGDTVLDNCMGSGTTGVACISTGRNFIGIELDEKWYEYAKERIKDEFSRRDETEAEPNVVGGEQMRMDI